MAGTCLFRARADSLASLDLVGAAETTLLAPSGLALTASLLCFRCTNHRARNQTGIHAASTRRGSGVVLRQSPFLDVLSARVCAPIVCDRYHTARTVRKVITELLCPGDTCGHAEKSEKGHFVLQPPCTHQRRTRVTRQLGRPSEPEVVTSLNLASLELE